MQEEERDKRENGPQHKQEAVEAVQYVESFEPASTKSPRGRGGLPWRRRRTGAASAPLKSKPVRCRSVSEKNLDYEKVENYSFEVRT